MDVPGHNVLKYTRILKKIISSLNNANISEFFIYYFNINIIHI